MASKRKRGRPVELAEDDIASIVASVELGCSLGSACLARGFGRTSWQRWVRVGEDAEARRLADPSAPLTDNETLFLDFLVRFRKARGAFLCQLEEKAADQAMVDPDAMQWLLERANPDDYGDPGQKKLDEAVAKLQEAMDAAKAKDGA